MNQPSLLFIVIIAGCFYAFGQHISSDPARNQDRMLTVQATGTSDTVPDIAHVTLGVQVQPQTTAAQATDMLAKQTTAVVDAVKKLGIEEKDIKTQNISVQPSYNYLEGKQELRGFEGNQQIEVTVRKTDQAGEVISSAAQVGANQIGGVRFEADNSDSWQLEAEKDAIANARAKGEELARSLNVRLGKVKHYNVSPDYGRPLPYAIEKSAMGGDAAVANPPVLPGTQTNSVTVTITYEIR